MNSVQPKTAGPAQIPVLTPEQMRQVSGGAVTMPESLRAPPRTNAVTMPE